MWGGLPAEISFKSFNLSENTFEHFEPSLIDGQGFKLLQAYARIMDRLNGLNVSFWGQPPTTHIFKERGVYSGKVSTNA